MDVPSPYERRGVPPPHQADDSLYSGDLLVGRGDSDLTWPDSTPEEIEAIRARIADRDARRIRPGFYEGIEPATLP